MSLDVTLYKELKANSISKLSLKEKAAIYEIYANYIEYEVPFIDNKKDILTINKFYNKNKSNIISLYTSNITHNLGEMANKANIYNALWRPYKLHGYDDKFEELDITYAKEIIDILEKGLKDMKNKPEYYKKYDSTNGWGLYIHFVPFIEKYLNACKKYPDAIIKIDR
jgi:hypothetical protein